MKNDQKQEINAKFAQINKQSRLKPKFQAIGCGYEEISKKSLLISGLILPPIIIVMSPYWISLFIKDLICNTILNYKCSNVQKELIRQKEASLVIIIQKNKIIEQILKNIHQTYPIIISKHKSKEFQFMWLIKKNNRNNLKKDNIIYWSELQKQFYDRKKIKKQSTESMYFFVGTQILNKNFTIESIYNKWKSQDNILYIWYEVLEVFG